MTKTEARLENKASILRKILQALDDDKGVEVLKDRTMINQLKEEGASKLLKQLQKSMRINQGDGQWNKRRSSCK